MNSVCFSFERFDNLEDFLNERIYILKQATRNKQVFEQDESYFYRLGYLTACEEILMFQELD
jgi:hypothetical protein